MDLNRHQVCLTRSATLLRQGNAIPCGELGV
jgi:hypothetical protein